MVHHSIWSIQPEGLVEERAIIGFQGRIGYDFGVFGEKKREMGKIYSEIFTLEIRRISMGVDDLLVLVEGDP